MEKELKELAKKLGNFGLKKFILEYLHYLCKHTLVPAQLASCFGFDFDMIAIIRAPPDSFSQNLKLYDFIAAVSTAERFINALYTTDSSNEHILLRLKTLVQKAELESARKNHLSANLCLRPNQTISDDDEQLDKVLDELKYLLENTLRIFQFATGLQSKFVISLEDVKDEYKVTDKRRDLYFLYDAVIQKRAWGELLFALEVSENWEVIRHLTSKNIWPLNETNIRTMGTEGETDRIESHSRKRWRETSEPKNEYEFGASCVIQSDGESSFTYAAANAKEGERKLTQFVPSEDTTTVKISRLSLSLEDLKHILRRCSNSIENLKLQDVEINHVDPNSNDYLSLPNIKHFYIHFFRNQSDITTDENCFKQNFFLNPHGHQLCELWKHRITTEFIHEKQRLFKMCPTEGVLILQYPVCEFLNVTEFFKVMEPSFLKSFSGENSKVKIDDIPLNIETLHLKNCLELRSSEGFSRFLHLKKLIISQPRVVGILNFDHIQNLLCLESIAAERVSVKNAQLVQKENKNFPNLTLLVFDDCLFKGFVPSSNAVLTEEPEEKTCIVMEKVDRNQWNVCKKSSFYNGRDETFQKQVNKAFQKFDFAVTLCS